MKFWIFHVFLLITLSAGFLLSGCQTPTDDTLEIPPIQMIFVPGGIIYPTNGFYTGGSAVPDFYIGKYELTNAEWNAVMGSGVKDNYPHVVSWFGAIEYCNRRSLKEGLTPCYRYLTYGSNPDDWPSGWNTNSENSLNVSCWNADGYRLPSDAEWEYTARGGLNTHDYTYSGSNDINAVGWYSGNSGILRRVGQLAANELGTYDMSGNMWEWCWDAHVDYPNSAFHRAMRGGVYYWDASFCKVSFRNFPSPDSDAGFRVCRNSP
jgi:formylglycine-generating enzyme required for sulfatase activity